MTKSGYSKPVTLIDGTFVRMIGKGKLFPDGLLSRRNVSLALLAALLSLKGNKLPNRAHKKGRRGREGESKRGRERKREGRESLWDHEVSS